MTNWEQIKEFWAQINDFYHGYRRQERKRSSDVNWQKKETFLSGLKKLQR
jgi:hypothetical protein